MKQSQLINEKFSERIKQVPRSFIRDILKVAASPDIISFAGGLPNKKFFPVKELAESTARVYKNNASTALQYSLTMGLPELRKLICSFYEEQGLKLDIDNIIITTGSQQALDLIGKTFINENDAVLLEEPSYLGAIQAFSMYRPDFKAVKLETDGIELAQWKKAVLEYQPKLSYMVTNFQNPSGVTYSLEKRKSIAEFIKEHNSLIVEDDPYGRIRFSGENLPNIFSFAPDYSILLGSFSKTIVPGFRLGWMVASKPIIEKIEVAKQAADLHTDIFTQHIVVDFLKSYDINIHLDKIKHAYKMQSDAMCEAVEHFFTDDFHLVKPQGGMFSWFAMPDGVSSMKVFEAAAKRKVAFVPGVPFYLDKKDSNTMRLNFSCTEPDVIWEGVKRLSRAVEEVCASSRRLIAAR